MPFLDFLKDWTQAQKPVGQTPQPQKPVTAKEMYAREAAQELADRKALSSMPAGEWAKVNAVKATLERATQHIDNGSHSRPVAPVEDAGHREAMRQNVAAQDKSAPALSPTSIELGKTALEHNASAPAAKPDVKAPEKAPARAPQTVPRRRPSWER